MSIFMSMFFRVCVPLGVCPYIAHIVFIPSSFPTKSVTSTRQAKKQHMLKGNFEPYGATVFTGVNKSTFTQNRERLSAANPQKYCQCCEILLGQINLEVVLLPPFLQICLFVCTHLSWNFAPNYCAIRNYCACFIGWVLNFCL